MALKSGVSESTVSSNIKDLMREGKSRREAIAMALSEKRKYTSMDASEFTEGSLDGIEMVEDPDLTKMATEMLTKISDVAAEPIEAAPVDSFQAMSPTALSDAAKLAIENRKKKRIFKQTQFE